MKKRILLMLMSALLTFAGLAWSSSDVLAAKADKAKPAKASVTRDEVYKKLGKVPPSEQKAAAKRARLLGLEPGIAGRATQAPAPSDGR